MGKMLKMGKVALVALGMTAFATNAQAAYTDDCITFSSAASFTLKTANSSKNWNGTLWTSTDKTNWTEWNGSAVSAAQTGGAYNLYVRGNTNNTKITGNNSTANWSFAGSGSIGCSGNIESLRGATGSEPSTVAMADFCYSGMFHGCTLLATAPALPATILSRSCYQSMFLGCTALTATPVLPASVMADLCYSRMFKDCTMLTNATMLPAMELAKSCYNVMFSGCTSLTTAPALPATTLVQGCYTTMFGGCTALKVAPILSATKLAPECCSHMFYNCTALMDVPALPVTTLAGRCYYGMFKGCVSLEVNAEVPGNEWKIPATSTTAYEWGTDMFYGTGGTLQGQPELNTTYYVKSALPLGSKGNPWKIGAGAGDTVNAWTNGMGTLVVEGAGRMKAFASDGSDVPWPVGDVAAVEISGEVASIGQNAWRGLGDGVTYNGLSTTAAKTMGDGFGGTAEYGRVAFKEFQVDGGSVQATVALETAKSLTNEWTEVELTDDDVRVENGRIVITHETDPQTQGFYLVQPTK